MTIGMKRIFVRAPLIAFFLVSSPWHQVPRGQDQKRPTLLVVTNRADGTVSIFDASGAPKLIGTVPVGADPSELCVAPDGNRAYILNRAGNSVSVIDLESLKVTATITHQKLLLPDACVVAHDSKKVYLAASNALLVVSAATNDVVKDVPVGKGLGRVVLSPDGRRLYISSNDTGDVHVVDATTETAVASIKAGQSSRNMAFTPDGKSLLVVHTIHDTVSLIDVATNEVMTTFGVGTAPQQVAVTSDGALGFVIARGNHQLNVIYMGGSGTRKALRSVDLLRSPIDMVATDRNIYVIHDGEDSLSVIRARTLEIFDYQTAKTGKGPQGIAIRP